MNRLEKRGFTVLELLVAVSVTALLAAMLFTITSQVIKTQTQSSGLGDKSGSPIHPRPHPGGFTMCHFAQRWQ